MSDYPMYGLSEEHQAVREAVRAVCDAKVAPFAADVDEQGRYPEEAAAALLAADFHAPHVPEEYGGAGADALATVLVIEEVARACMSASLIPAVNKLGSLPVMLGGGEEIRKKYLTKLAAGEGGFSYALSEPEAGSDAASMTTKAERPSRSSKRGHSGPPGFPAAGQHPLVYSPGLCFVTPSRAHGGRQGDGASFAVRS